MRIKERQTIEVSKYIFCGCTPVEIYGKENQGKYDFSDLRLTVDYDELENGDAIKLLGLKETLQKQGRPEYRKDEAVIFSTKINGMEVDGYGTIKQVHAYGTKVMDREVTYDIYGVKSGGAGAKELFENIAESQLMSAIL